MSEVASPSGRPDMGGSGSPAPSNTRPGAAGCGPPDAAAEALGGAEVVAAVPGRDRSGIGGSGADARPVGPDIAALDAGGGGCDGRPAATRWPAAGASGRSGLARWIGGSFGDAGEDEPAEGVPDNLSNRSASVSCGSEVADAASGSGGLRPLLPGGVLSEFTAYTPTSTPTIAATTASNSGTDLPPSTASALHPAGCRSNSQAESDSRTATLEGNMAKGGNRDSAPTRDNATPARRHDGIEKSLRDYPAVNSDIVSAGVARCAC
jgi:hypothetical protein